MQQSSNDAFDNPLRLQRVSYPHWITERVRWSDTDMAGHANNLSFGAFCEVSRALILRNIIHPDSEQRGSLLLAEFRLRFLSELHWPDEVDIGSGISVIGNSSYVFANALFKGDRCVAVADSRMVMIDDSTRRSRSLSANVLDVLKRWKLILPEGEKVCGKERK